LVEFVDHAPGSEITLDGVEERFVMRKFSVKGFGILVLLVLSSTATIGHRSPTQSRYLTTGIFIASIEEGARIFTPVRLLPFEHPEAFNHEFPTVQQLHAGEDQLLLIIGEAAGLRLRATIQRYPREPDANWPYAPFQPPPVELLRTARTTIRPAKDSSLPGLRAVAYVDRFPVSFIVDTRGLSLSERHMQQATTMGLDITRKAFVDGLTSASRFVPEHGPAILVFKAKTK